MAAMKRLGLILVLIGLGWSMQPVLAGGGPCNYIVLYDETDTNSIAVANYYQQVRNIPERNMVPYTFFPAGRTSYARTNLWDLAVYLRQVIQDRGLAGRFNGIAVAGTVPLLGSSWQLGFQSGLYFSPGFDRWGAFTNNYSNFAYANPTSPVTREIRDDKPFVSGGVTNVYWPVSFVGFTGVNGNTPDEVFALLDRSKAADGARPDGVVYWPTNSDIRSLTRESEINDVAATWKARGIRYLVTGSGTGWVTGMSDIAGEFVGSASGDQGINGNTYLPGAWVDHLTSNGGQLSRFGGGGQSSACAWIRAGAYGTSGTASEPYAVADKFPHANIHTHLRAGASMAEAFWQSVSFPEEIVMVGDPLLQAWAQIPQVSISSPADEAVLSGTVAINASASTVHPDGLETQYELAVDGHIVRIGSTNETISATWTGSGFSLDTATLADGWHDLRVVAYNNNAIHTQGEARRTVFVNNSSQSVTLTGPGALEYTSNGTFTVNLSGIATATNVTIQANGRTLASLSNSGGSTNLSSSLFGYQGHTKLYALAWLNNGKQVWSAPLDVSMTWAPVPATPVTPGSSIAQIRYFGSTVTTNFDWDSTTPDAVTNFAGPVLTEGWDGTLRYRSFSVGTNTLPDYIPGSFTDRPGFDSTMYFLAPIDALYEFAVNDAAITNIWLEVDGQRIRHGTSTSDNDIKPAPIKLSAGFHPVRLRFQATASTYLAELWYRGGPTPGNYNYAYANYQFQRLNEFVCFGPAVTGNVPPVITSELVSVPNAGKTTANISVGATDPDSTNALTYTWAKIDGPGKMLVNTNIVNSPTNLATFYRAGNYRIRVLVSDGLSVTTNEVTAVATSAYSTVVLSSTGLMMRAGTSVQLSAAQKDQFGTSFTNRAFVWSVVGGGTVTSNGLYTAPFIDSTNQVVATVGSYSATSTITVLSNFSPAISSVSVQNYGDHLRCSVTADDDMGVTNLTYIWVPVGTQPGTITFASNGTATNPADGYFTRFGTYKIQVGVTDSSGATTWGGTNTITVGPTINGSTVIDTAGNGDGRIDPNESANLFVELYRGADYGTNLPFSAVLTVTNTPGLTVVQPNSAYPTNSPMWLTSSNLVPFSISASSNLVDKNTRDLILTVTIGGASGDLPFSLPAGAPYTVAQTSGVSIVSGTNDVGVHDMYFGGTNIALPFAYSFGGQSFTNVFVNGNGILQFSSKDIYNYSGTIPEPGFTNAMAVHWDLLRLNGTGAGIFTSVSGTAPNRIFNIEWRAVRYFDTNQVINCEARLYESELRVDMIYGIVGNSGADASVGVQVSPLSYIAYSNYQPVLTNGLQLSFIMKNETGAPTAHFNASPASGWVPLTVTFTDTSSGGITNRFWDFGDGSTLNTTATSVSHTYTTVGTNTVQLIVSGLEGSSTNTQVAAVTVTLPVAPTASFTGTPTSGTTPLTVTFTDTSSGDITNRFWSFGDGTTTNTLLTSLVHTYTAVGSNTVQLIVSGPAGANTNTIVNYIDVKAADSISTNIIANPADQQWASNVTSGWVGQASARIGSSSASNVTSGLVLPFWIPDLKGKQILSASLSLTLNSPISSWIYGGTAAVYGVRSSAVSNPATYASDYTNGVKLVDNYFPISGKVAVSSPMTTNSDALTAWLVEQAGTNGQKFVFLAVKPNGTTFPAANYYANVNTANSTNGGYPTLTLLLGTQGTTNSPPAKYIDVSTNALSVTEAATNSFQIRLSSQPDASVTVNVSRVSGETNIQVVSSSVVFTVSDWNIWRPVYIATLVDADTNNGIATIQAADAGGAYTSTNITATQIDTMVFLDSNGNGIPDSWEQQYGITNSNPNVLSANGINTILESYIAGLNPTNPSSRFGLSVQQIASQRLLQWTAVSGRVYSVYWTTNLLNSFQPQATNIIWPQNSWTGQINEAPGAFYKLKVELQK